MDRGIHSRRHGRVAVLTVSDPSRRNAMALDLAEQLVAAVAAAEADSGIGALVVTGQEPGFCAGADLGELEGTKEDILRRIYRGFTAIADCTLPTVAAVNGAAVGAGMNLALACDVRIAGPKARFDSRFLRLGLHPGGGYTWMAQRALGRQGAAAVTLFGEVLGADEAERAGLVWRSADDAVTTAVELAGRAAEVPRDLAIATKRTLAVTAALERRADALEVEIRSQVTTLDSAEFAARLAAQQGSKSSRK